MKTDFLKSTVLGVTDCHIKDETGLNDFQKLPDQSGIAIPRVGIERFRIPLKFQDQAANIVGHDCEVSMFVYLDGNKTGVNMSRFCSILQSEAEVSFVDQEFLKRVLSRYRHEMRDFDSEPLIPQAELIINFQLPLKQKSLKSENWGWQYYPCEIHGARKRQRSVSIGIHAQL